MNPVKPKIALYWCASCGGCEESVVDLAEDLLEVAEAVDIVFWPVAMDYKVSDVAAMRDGDIAAALINGAVRTDEQEEMARLLRRKSQLVFAHGSCAHLGGAIGLANLYTREELLDRAFREVPSVHNPEGILPVVAPDAPGAQSALPDLHENVKPLDRVVEVDYYLPGCPPPPDLIRRAFEALLEGDLPPKGSVLGSRKALCDTCSRKTSRNEKLKTTGFQRVHETEWDAERCFLDQGIICLGPATRGGCGEMCVGGNQPCRGCFGPTDNVLDQGASFLSALAAIVDTNDEDELRAIADSIPDPVGTFYKYGLAASILAGKAYGGVQ